MMVVTQEGDELLRIRGTRIQVGCPTGYKWRRMPFQFFYKDGVIMVILKRGKASFEAEKTIRDAGEKASGLYGAEAWCSMHGPRYDELFAKQARIEREMLGLND